MNYRKFGKTGRTVSDVGFGAWAIGGAWGDVSEADARAALHAALDNGTTFIDTADVYGDGRSEKIIADVMKERGGERPFIATKAGRRLDPHVSEGYNKQNLTAFVERSLQNLATDCLDLVQLHCPPTEVFYRPDVFEVMEDMVTAGKIRNYGVSVEKVEEGLKAIEYPGVASVQIIYNIFRQRPSGLFFREAKAKNVGVIVRVPLASGLLTGKMTKDTAFAADDHRAFNRNGEAFDKGETFAGVPFDVALEAVEEIRRLVPENITMAQFALRWILMEEAVGVVIPGAKNAAQAAANAVASDVAPLPPEVIGELRNIYEHRIAPHVHHLW
ncbi:aldo/keto reductase [Thalassospira lucentensis]|uniref:Aldo/keto reductase n=1 Tax=Thalassospira lucentensis TaxID=168935 RepID=A0A358HZY9_9PROT|nr:aldo/keto reductase [Thalassospira lucentensis]HBV00747.1 aldo/keto reductase [Thalassospira lucentensis]HCW67980.1 aldo/keto reductase [Thalassospira lucentensis]|tara:strand:+ start:54 stop:1040 length:987 start_codon:yes stop_codon:yes gene_type:complete